MTSCGSVSRGTRWHLVLQRKENRRLRRACGYVLRLSGQVLRPSRATVKIAPTIISQEARSKQALQKPRLLSSMSRASFLIEIVIGF